MTGTVPAAISSGTSVAVAVPNTISSTTHRDRDRDLLAALQVGVEDGLQVVVDGDLAADVDASAARPSRSRARIGSTRSAAGWGSSRVSICANDESRPRRLERADAGVGERRAPRACSAAAWAAGAMSPENTIV